VISRRETVIRWSVLDEKQAVDNSFLDEEFEIAEEI